MTSVLKRQIATYAESATRPIANAGELGDLISVGLQLVDAIGASIQRWQGRIKAGEVQYQSADAQGCMDGYAALHRAFGHLQEVGGSGGENNNIPLGETWQRSTLSDPAIR